MVRSGLLQEGGMTLVSLVPRDVLVQESGRIIREMLICYGIICALTFCTASTGQPAVFLAGYTGWIRPWRLWIRESWSPLMCRSAGMNWASDPAL